MAASVEQDNGRVVPVAGTVSALRAGSATISVTVNGETASAELVVAPQRGAARGQSSCPRVVHRPRAACGELAD